MDTNQTIVDKYGFTFEQHIHLAELNKEIGILYKKPDPIKAEDYFKNYIWHRQQSEKFKKGITYNQACLELSNKEIIS